MPSFSIPIGGIVKAITYCTIPGQVSVNSRMWQLTNLTSGQAFSSNMFTITYDTTMLPLYVSLLSDAALYYGTQVYLQNPIGLPPRPDSDNANQSPGQGPGGLLPSQTAGLISLKTSTLGKIGQGRVYVPFPYNVANEVNGSPTVVYMENLSNLGTFLSQPFAVIDGGITATFRPCLYRGGTDTPRFIDQAVPHDAWATQRRRGAYGRLNANPF